jgi:hypothetical protein
MFHDRTFVQNEPFWNYKYTNYGRFKKQKNAKWQGRQLLRREARRYFSLRFVALFGNFIIQTLFIFHLNSVCYGFIQNLIQTR